MSVSRDQHERLDVLIAAQPTTYGVAVCVRQLAEAAVSAGHRVTVACPGPTAGPLAGWVASSGAEHAPLDMVRDPGFRDVTDLLALRRLAREKDVVHLHSSKAAALGRVGAASLGRDRPVVVVTPHYWSWLVGGRAATVYRWIERALAPLCDAIVAVSEREAAEGRRALGRASARIVVIPNGVDRTRFSPDGAAADRGGDTPLIVCVGRLSHQKGQDTAIRALALMGDPSARLRFVGGESHAGERSRLQTLARSLGVTSRIEWRDHTADAAPELRAADVMIAPSRWEGMSLVLLEALACGVPVVASDVSGSEALGEAGVIVPTEDPAALGAAIDALLLDPGRRRQLREAARTQSAAYDLASTLQRNLDLWSDLARDRRERHPPRPER